MGCHVVIQRTYNRYEVWAPCPEAHCSTYHKCVAESESEYDANRIARALNPPAPTEEDEK